MKNLKSISFGILLIIAFGISGQPSGHPNDIKWKYIESQYFQIIYPQGRYDEAARIAAIVKRMNKEKPFANDAKNRTIDIVLQTNQVVANGYVGIGPYQSEYYATPLQNTNILSSTNWLDLLSIHEYRHVQQLNNTKVGLTKAASILLGQAGWAGLRFFAMPNWFAEGDAVRAETMFSETGRGRTPAFLARQKAIILDGRKYTYSKMRGGSFKDFVPNHYVFGYILTDYLAKEKGEEMWDKVINRSSLFYNPILPFSRALKKETGLYVNDLYKKAYEDFETKVKPQLKERSPEGTILSKKSTTPTLYSYPFKVGQSYYSFKESYKKLSHIVKITNGKEKKLTEIGINTEDYLAYRDSFFTWTELSQHPRWTFRNYSDIYLYDLKYGTRRKLTDSGKYFSPDPNRKENLVLAAHMDSSLISKIAFVNMTTGLPEMLLDPDNKGFVTYPKWVNNEEMIYISRKDASTTIYHLDLNKLIHSKLIEVKSALINEPSINGRKIYFTSSMDGSDQIYSLNIDDKSLEKLTNETIGAYSPSVSKDGELLYQTITATGSDIRTKSNNIGQSFSFTPPTLDENKLANSNLDVADYKEHGYKRMSSIQLHSYTPTIDQNKIGMSLLWSNTLSNIKGNTDFFYNRNESAFQSEVNLSFSSAYPTLDLNIAPSRRSALLISPADTFAVSRFSETNYGLSIGLPYDWINGNYFTGFSVNIGAGHRSLSGIDRVVAPRNLESFQDISFGLRFYNRKRITPQNVGTRFGQQLSFSYRQAASKIEASRLRIEGNLFLPGFFANDRFKLDAEYYSEDVLNDYKYPNIFIYARGVNPVLFSNSIRLSANYGFPLFYPEIGIRNLIYLKRARMNLFGDYGRYNTFDTSVHVNSVGSELMFDTIVFSAIPIALGVRYSYVNDILVKKRSDFQFISSINF
jgi:hypothetical protein